MVLLLHRSVYSAVCVCAGNETHPLSAILGRQLLCNSIWWYSWLNSCSQLAQLSRNASFFSLTRRRWFHQRWFSEYKQWVQRIWNKRRAEKGFNSETDGRWSAGRKMIGQKRWREFHSAGKRSDANRKRKAAEIQKKERKHLPNLHYDVSANISSTAKNTSASIWRHTTGSVTFYWRQLNERRMKTMSGSDYAMVTVSDRTISSPETLAVPRQVTGKRWVNMSAVETALF